MTTAPDPEVEVIREAVAEVAESEEPLRDALDDAREADLDTMRRAGIDS
ncbi:hypothetical protein [Nocardioides sp. TF02-7]|nr:hypothetical protein [Nocardioides sp. TF02-7]UMG94153.1 hypothetical protein MF408_09015 [Nocardioides sp. TF02-7]